MRTLVIIQALIIVGGAYYIYTLRQGNPSAESVVEVQVVSEPDEVESEVLMDSDAPDVQVESSTNPTPGAISGPSDVGMEFPIPDDESSLLGN